MLSSQTWTRHWDCRQSNQRWCINRTQQDPAVRWTALARNSHPAINFTSALCKQEVSTAGSLHWGAVDSSRGFRVSKAKAAECSLTLFLQRILKKRLLGRLSMAQQVFAQEILVLPEKIIFGLLIVNGKLNSQFAKLELTSFILLYFGMEKLAADTSESSG